VGYEDYRAQAPSLFKDDITFTQSAFEELYTSKLLEQMPEFHPQRPEFSVLVNDELRRRCEFIPQEAIPANWAFRLTTDRERVMTAIADARKRQGEWPREQLFWDLHPVAEWLMDKLMVRFGRHQAPVIISSELQEKDCIYLFQGVISNKRSQPVINDWFGLCGEDGADWTVFYWDDVVALTGLQNSLSNPGLPSKQIDLIRSQLPGAVEFTKTHMLNLRTERADTERRRLQDDMRRLQRWHGATTDRIQTQLTGAHGVSRARYERELEEADKISQHRQQWLKESFSSDPTPYLRLAAVFSGS